MRWFLRCLLALGLAAFGLEVALRVTPIGSGGFARDEQVILCVGDSFTFGSGVSAEEAYPAQLQKLLDADEPGRYRVVNLGVSGWNTTQVLIRFRDQVRRNDPAMLLVSAGLNDYWNLSEIDRRPAEWRLWLDSVAMHSQLYRAARRWLYRSRLDVEPEVLPAARPSLILLGGDRVRVVIDGSIDEFVVQKRDWRVDSESTELVTRNLAAVARWALDAGVPIAFINYPGSAEVLATPSGGGDSSVGAYEAANAAIRMAAGETGVSVIEFHQSIARVPEDERAWVFGGHPNPPIYAEVARDVAELVVATIGTDPQ